MVRAARGLPPTLTVVRVWPPHDGASRGHTREPKDGPMLKLLLIIALVVVVIMFVVPAMRRRS